MIQYLPMLMIISRKKRWILWSTVKSEIAEKATQNAEKMLKTSNFFAAAHVGTAGKY